MTGSPESSPAAARAGPFVLLGALLIVLAVLASAGTGLRNGFINFDDPDVVVGNPRLERASLKDAVEVFGEIRDHAYLPLYYIALMPEASIAGKDPAAFHLGSLVWHALNGILVLLLLLSVTGRRFVALACALLYVVHPLTVESVAWVSGRKDQASLALLLLGLLAFSRWARLPGAGRLALAAVLLFLSCFAKGSTVVFPLLAGLVLVVMRALGRTRPGLRSAFALLLLLVLAAIPAAVHYEIARREGTAGAAAGFGPAEGALHFLLALERYATHLLVPVRLSIHYPTPPAPGFSVAGALVLVLLAGTGLLVFRGKRRLAGFACAWLLVSLLPFNDVLPRTSVTAADRYLAVGLPGFTLLLALALARLPARIAALLLVLAAASLGWLTDARTREFRDGETVFRSAMRVEPEDPLPPEQLAEALLESRARTGTEARKEAVALLARSVGLAERGLDPVATVRARLRSADTLLRMRLFAQALEGFDRVKAAAAEDPGRFGRLGLDLLVIESNRAQCLVGLGRPTDAREALEAILAREPGHPASKLTLAMLDVRDGFAVLDSASLEEVRDRARQAVNRGIDGFKDVITASAGARRPSGQGKIPDDVEVRARTELGRALVLASWRKSRFVEAHAEVEALLSRWPDRPEGYLLRADLDEAVGDRNAALEDLTRAIKRDPGDVTARLRASRHLRAAGENRRAVEFLRIALASDPENAAVRRELSAIYVAQANSHKNQRDFDQALLSATEARTLDPDSPEAWVAEGETHEARQDWEKASSSYERALKIDGKCEEAKRGLARFHQARGISLLSELKKRVAAAKAPERAEVERELRDRVMADFRLALELGAASSEVEIARRHVRESERGDRREAAVAIRERATAELALGHVPESVELLKQAIRADGTDIESHYLLAKAEMERKDVDAALKSLEDVIALDPEYFPALVVATRLYYVKGRFDAARKTGERALKLGAEESVATAYRSELDSVRKILDLAK